MNGRAHNMYVRLQPVQHAHADGVYDAINNAFIGVGVPDWRAKVVGVGCDGASVNLGARNSVMTRIRDGLPYIVPMHCIAHRLELGKPY